MTSPAPLSDLASDVDVLPLQLIEEHVGLERGAFPECPVLEELVRGESRKIDRCTRSEGGGRLGE